MKTFTGKPKGTGKRIAVVVAKFNDFITNKLLSACLRELERAGVKKTDIRIHWVPGAFEIPLVAQRCARKKSVDAVICLGAIVRGETYHYELVAQGCAHGVMQASLSTGKPVIFEVLSVDTLEQAYKRSEDDGNNKGADAAYAALEMVDLITQM